MIKKKRVGRGGSSVEEFEQNGSRSQTHRTRKGKLQSPRHLLWVETEIITARRKLGFSTLTFANVRMKKYGDGEKSCEASKS